MARLLKEMLLKNGRPGIVSYLALYWGRGRVWGYKFFLKKNGFENQSLFLFVARRSFEPVSASGG